jgi:hypothetical protein
LLVLLAELTIGVESALAVKKQPLAMIAKANVISFFTLWFLRVRHRHARLSFYNYTYSKSNASLK